jgi:phage replication initiation protein
MNDKIEIVVDFLTFTVHDGWQADEVVESILGMDVMEFEHLAKGFNFYSRSMVYSDIRVLYDGMSNMGVCVNMSGRGCRVFEDYHGESLLSFLRQINERPYISITRLDIACDDKVGMLSLEKMWQHSTDGNYRTRLQARNIQESFKGKRDGAKSLYFGSSCSLYRIRIYDKGKQTGEGGHWVRFEIVLKDDYAKQAVNVMVASKNLGNAVSGIIDDKFAFVELGDNDVLQYKLADWWVEFLGEVQTVKLTSKQKIFHDIDEHKKWLKESCGRIIAKVVEAIGEEQFKREICDYGKKKLTVADEAMIKDYRRRVEVAGLSVDVKLKSEVTA